MNEREISNATTTTKQTCASANVKSITTLFYDNCKFTSPWLNSSVSRNNNNYTNDNMQPLQRTQPQQQQQNQHHQQLLHLQMTTESLPAMDGTLPLPPNDTTICTIEANSRSSIASSPPSPLSTSSLSSSASSSSETVTPSLGVNLRVTGQCSQGGRKYMEDYFSVAYQHSENAKDLEYAFFGIFDGHGGAEAASFAKEHLMMEIINQKLFWSDSDQDVLRAIREGYIATHFAMWRDQDKWPKTANGLPSTAGTTATIAFIRHEKIYIGHVGDSGIVLGYQNEGEKYWRAKQLTIDHKPESIIERTRIMRSGGKVVVKSGVPRVVWNRPRNADHRGPIKHNTLIDEIPFLAVARSLGDLWSYNSLCNEFVVSPDPDVRVIKINPKTFRCLIFGTDGLWNVVTPQEAVNTVYQKEIMNERLQMQRGENLSSENGWTNPSKGLVDRALSTWASKKMRADNTSVVTVILHPPSSSSLNSCDIIENDCAEAKLEGCLNESLGMEYVHMNGAYASFDDKVTYREMAEKYQPPEEYRNFNYYEDTEECNISGNKTYYDKHYTKLIVTNSRYPLPTTIAALEMMCNEKEQVERIGCRGTEFTTGDVNASTADDDDTDETDDEECDDGEEDDGDDDDEEVTVETNESAVLAVDDYASHYKDLTTTAQSFSIHSANTEDATTSSYMTTFAESYNTLLGGDIISDTHMSAEVSTSNSSNSYKSHCGSNIHELVQEQQRYQQQCMSEEEGYSLTKLETRREQQRCSAGVQTFRIFQHQQQIEGEARLHPANDSRSSLMATGASTSNANCEQEFMWEPRFPTIFGTSQRYPTYQSQPQQSQQPFVVEPQQQKPLELNSLLQQEREEERQVELERRMEMERIQQQEQKLQPENEDSTTATSTYMITHGSTAKTDRSLPGSSSPVESESDVTLDVEYLLDDEAELEDTSVQINEISSSSSLMEAEMSTKVLSSSSSASLKSSCASSTSSSPMLSPSSSSSRETHFNDVIEPTSETAFSVNESNTIKCSTSAGTPKIIEKLEKIEILHEKPELVIESLPTTSTTLMSVRRKHKTTIQPTKRHSRTNVTTRLHFPNIPNENQHQRTQQTRSHLSKNSLLRLTPAAVADTAAFYNKRQLRSASSSNSITGSRKPFFSPSATSSTNIDYTKRTLRTRNSFTKDLKTKATMLASSIKRSAATVTTRFLRAQAVTLLDMHQNSQVLVANGKKQAATTSTSFMRATTQQHRPQQQQHTLSAATLNFINLRSRQVGGSGVGNARATGLVDYTQQQQPTSIGTTHRSASRPIQMRIATPNNPSVAATALTQPAAIIRRNLRSVSSRPLEKTTLCASTSTTGLTNYCKSTRLHASSNLVMPSSPPPPKHLNSVTANVTIAVTAKTADSTSPISAANVLSSASRKRNASCCGRASGLKEMSLNATPIATNVRATKRLRR